MFCFSNKELWQHLERAENEGQILFSWSNSLSQHKKFFSLCICPERPPPLQVIIIISELVQQDGRGKKTANLL